MQRALKLEITVIGRGNWGTSLAAAIRRSGLTLRAALGRGNWRMPLDAGLIWICVPDDAIATVAAQIAHRRRKMTGQIAVHSSGALTAEVLAPLRAAGASIAAVHPVMSFPSLEVIPLKNVLFGVEAEKPVVRRKLHAVVRSLGGRPFEVQAEGKALYHAAATLSSPLLASAVAAAMETAALAGMPREIVPEWVEVLSSATIANISRRGLKRSFSGPFARGDAATVELHLQALAAHPILADVYRSLAVHALTSLPIKNAEALRRVLGVVGDGRAASA
jgi:predicted short-subunit dehydrogenase-like oxidoreductase (DUF2520 family)